MHVRHQIDVMDSKLAQVVDRGREAGFVIIVVTSYSNSLTLIMDAGTAFTGQVYVLAEFFLHEVNSANVLD